ncbi:hypothetical protein [Kribbella sp. NPDC050459]|uniref:hypothetical protein n=1 Tax=Kribbella sp. NPDC050459 TaxID=3155785 RepID=UPI0033E25156
MSGQDLCVRSTGFGITVEAELAKVSFGDVMTAIRRSTHNEQVAAAFRRIVAMPIALLISWFVLIVATAILLGAVSAIIRGKGGSMIEDYAGWWAPGITVASVLAVIIGRRRIFAAADETGGRTFPRPARSTWSANARGTGVFYAFIGLGRVC